MANIRIIDVPEDATPSPDDLVLLDQANTRSATITDVVNAARPLANQTEAEAGTAADKGMSPLTVKQAIDAQRPAGTTGLLVLDAETPADARTVMELGTASTSATADFATAAQGTLADTAVQPAGLATVATTGQYTDLTGTPTLGTAAAEDSTAFATSAQGLLANSAVQPGDGEAVPAGGTTGQVLAKASATDGDTFWTIAGQGDIISTNNGSDFEDPLAVTGNLLFAQTGTGAVERSVLDKLRSKVVSIQDYGTSADWSAALTAARTAVGADGVIVLERGVENAYNQNDTNNMYGSYSTEAVALQYLAGTVAAPSSRGEPVIWIEKVSAADRDVNPAYWEQGAIYGSVHKVSGGAYTTAITGYALASGTSSGDHIGVHGRATVASPDAAGFGGWFYGIVSDPDYDRAVGVEINMRSFDPVVQPAWTEGLGAQSIDGMFIALTDDAIGATRAVRIAGNATARFRTGIQFQQAISPSVGGNGEVILVRGGASIGERHGGFRFYDGNLDYGLDTHGASFGDNSAIWLGNTHRIVWGSSKSATRYFTADATTGVATLAGFVLDLASSTGELRIAGTKVVDSQQAALPSDATDAATAVTLANAIKARMISHGLVAA